jgi:ribonuclease R
MVWKNGHLFGSAFCLRGSKYIIETKDDTIPEEISITGTSYQVSAEIVAATLKMD